jgi:hypothetical protein
MADSDKKVRIMDNICLLTKSGLDLLSMNTSFLYSFPSLQHIFTFFCNFMAVEKNTQIHKTSINLKVVIFDTIFC